MCNVYTLLQQNEKAMRQNHHREHDDQETIYLFYILIILYIPTYSGPASIREANDEKKHLHLVKYEQKNYFIKYNIYRSNIL